MSDQGSPREIARPCSISVANMRKAVTTARKRNKVTGPAKRAEIMAVIEDHIDNLDGPEADALEDMMSQSPLNMTDIYVARAEMKRFFHPRASAMKMQDLVEYVYWTSKALGWNWTELDQFTEKVRQPRGCRKSQRPGKSLVPPATALGTVQKRKPSKYNLHIRKYTQQHKSEHDNQKDLFKAAVQAWNEGKNRREGAAYGARRRAYKKAAPQRELERVERSKQIQRDIREEEDARPEVQERRARIKRAGKVPRRSTRKRNPPQRGMGMMSSSDDEDM
jgi:hypothetical protein